MKALPASPALLAFLFPSRRAGRTDLPIGFLFDQRSARSRVAPARFDPSVG